MLNVVVTDDGYDVDDDLRQFAQEKFASLDSHIQGLAEVHVVFSRVGGEKGEASIRAQAAGGGHHFEASATARNARAAVDDTLREMQLQIDRQKSRDLDHRDQRHQRH